MLSILRKDLAAHFWALAPASAVTLVLMSVLVGQRVYDGQPVLPAFRLFVVLGLAPLAWLLVNRLVVHEYTGGGERVLERLPVRPLAVFAAKVVLAVGMLAGLLVLALSTLSSGAAAFSRPIPDPQVSFMLERSLGFLAAFTAALLLSASLGRLRHGLNALAIGGLLLAMQAGLDPLGVAPLDYLREDFVAPRTEGRLVAPLVAVALLALAAILTCLRPMGRWRGPATPTDLAACAVVGLVTATIALNQADTSPFVQGGATVRWAREGVSLNVRKGSGGDAARGLAAAVGGDLALMADALGRALPEVSVDLGSDLGPSTFQRADLSVPGVLVRANFVRDDFAEGTFRAWLAQQAFDVVCDGRLLRGDSRLLHDGYPRWLVGQRGAGLDEHREELRLAWAAHVLAQDDLLDDTLLERWGAVRSRLGAPIARSVAAQALRLVSGRRGPQAVHRLVRTVLDRRRGAFGGLRDPSVDALLRDGDRRSTIDLSKELAADLSRRAHAVDWEDLVPVVLAPARGTGDVALRFGATGPTGRIALLHTLAGASVPDRYERDEVAAGSELLDTSARYPSGARVRWTVARHAPELGCDVITGWRELRVP